MKTEEQIKERLRTIEDWCAKADSGSEREATLMSAMQELNGVLGDQTMTADTRIKWEKIIRSKTLWINMIALVALAIQTSTGMIIDIQTQASLIIVINLGLRIITKEGFMEEKD